MFACHDPLLSLLAKADLRDLGPEIERLKSVRRCRNLLGGSQVEMGLFCGLLIDDTPHRKRSYHPNGGGLFSKSLQYVARLVGMEFQYDVNA